MTKNHARATAARRQLGDVPTQLAALSDMTVGDLAERYLALYGEPTRSRNKDYLRKRLSWRIQELAEGGLPAQAVQRIGELGDGIPERWRMRQAEKQQNQPPPAPVERDPRLPGVGGVLRRVYQGVPHEVTVAEDGFDYGGARFKTLSAVARHITGTAWNGFLFFGLKAAPDGATTTPASPQGSEVAA